MTPNSRQKLVVGYVVGMPFSGSTVLDRLVARSQSVFSVCELHHQRLFSSCGLGSIRCQCGDAWPCKFWRAVDQVFLKKTGISFLKESTLFDSGRHSDLADYLRLSEAIYAAISDVSGKSVIFDSSKSKRVLACLLTSDVLDIRPVHLVRHPYGNVVSTMKYENVGLVHAATRYRRRHSRIQKILGDVPHLRINYEQLCQHPTETLNAVTRFLGVPDHPGLESSQPESYHGIGGNRFAHARKELKQVETWGQETNVLDRLLIDILTSRVRALYAGVQE